MKMRCPECNSKMFYDKYGYGGHICDCGITFQDACRIARERVIPDKDDLTSYTKTELLMQFDGGESNAKQWNSD